MRMRGVGLYKMHVGIQLENIKEKYLDNEKERNKWLAQNRPLIKTCKHKKVKK
jgi:hypothetical protein